jgi:CDGSH-type Zn-finger protein/uncharacterized Fe-S cluster protein YjdI
MPAKEYASDEVVIRYDPALCVHAAECMRGAPLVFDPDARPWIQPERGDPEHLAQVVRRCPTGALTLRFVDNRVAETPDAHNTATLAADGPIYLRGRIVYGGSGEHASIVEYTRIALCRCGASRNKPFCDNSHRQASFSGGSHCSAPHKPLPGADDPQPCCGPVRVQPLPDGPLKVEGWVEFKAVDGSRYVAGAKCWLCRCGHSQTKPFCDGSHKRVGFRG